jgi:pimeloyl-ACP methyl ester carboxylesterase
MIALAEGGRFSELPDLLFPVFVHRNRQGDEALRAIVRTMAEETGPQAFVRQQRAIMTRPDCRPLLSSVRCPTLVLVGDGDELTPPALSEEIAAGIASAQLVRVPDCGHLSTLERPEAVNRALVEWLKE